MVSRQIRYSTVTADCYDANRQQQYPITRTFYGRLRDSDARRLFRLAMPVAINILKFYPVIKGITFRGMDEDTFMKYSVELDYETRKPIKENENQGE